jgi:hypothetical protein
VLFYVFKVRVHFPSRPRNPRRTIPAFNGSGAGGSGRASAPPASPAWGQAQQKTKCTCQGGTIPCYGCSNGYVHGTRDERHYACNGTGRLRCQMCNGTGYRSLRMGIRMSVNNIGQQCCRNLLPPRVGVSRPYAKGPLSGREGRGLAAGSPLAMLEPRTLCFM